MYEAVLDNTFFCLLIQVGNYFCVGSIRYRHYSFDFQAALILMPRPWIQGLSIGGLLSRSGACISPSRPIPSPSLALTPCISSSCFSPRASPIPSITSTSCLSAPNLYQTSLSAGRKSRPPSSISQYSHLNRGNVINERYPGLRPTDLILRPGRALSMVPRAPLRVDHLALPPDEKVPPTVFVR